MTASAPVVEFEAVSKHFGIAGGAGWRSAIPLLSPPVRAVPALDGIDLEVGRGEALGIVGPNGAGKSTLLKLLVGVLSPTSGTIRARGRVSPMIELGIGFHPRLTARENIVCSGVLLGVEPDVMASRIDEVLEFAGLTAEGDLPIREFSTGMVARLGFATSIHVDADILAVDEVLSVGDQEFQDRCLDRIERLVAGGGSLLFVSHDLALVRLVCDRAVLLRDGRVADFGDVGPLLERYEGRRAPQVDQSPAVSIESFTVHTPDGTVARGASVDFELVVNTVTPSPVSEIQAYLGVPTLDPDLMVVESRHVVEPGLLSVGRHRLGGRTTPIPMEGGMLRLTVQLLGPDGRALAAGFDDFQMAGPRRLKPMYGMEPTTTVTRLTDTADSVPPAVSHRVDDPVMAIDGATKYFASDRDGELRHRALNSVDIQVAAGEAVGVIGPNGAGKSTLLRCAAGISRLDGGHVVAGGRIMPMLELGVGFRGELDGWENLELTAALLGATTSELAAAKARIVDFSGIGASMSAPVREWSTGMRARLGFSICSHLKADVYLIDEVLAVGDLEFRRRAVAKLAALRAQGAGVVFVSHDLALVGEVCTRAVRLEHGKVVASGPALEVIDHYGGLGWAGGESLGTAGIKIDDLSLEVTHNGSGRPRAHVVAVVDAQDPAPHIRFEMSLRDPAGRADIDRNDAQRHELYTAAQAVIVPEGGFSAAGRYRLIVDSGELAGSGVLHLVVSAIDAVSGAVVAERWVTGRFGAASSSGDGVPAQIEFGFDLAPAGPV